MRSRRTKCESGLLFGDVVTVKASLPDLLLMLQSLHLSHEDEERIWMERGGRGRKEEEEENRFLAVRDDL